MKIIDHPKPKDFLEFQTMRQIKSYHTIQVVEVFEPPGQIKIIMELAAGGDLKQFID